MIKASTTSNEDAVEFAILHISTKTNNQTT